MKKYKIWASSTEIYTLEIEAIDEDHAWEYAKEADGSLFEPVKYSADWNIDSVNEVQK